MSLISNKRIVYINSRFRTSGTDENFTISVDLQQETDFDRVVVLQASIPKSYYAIQAGQNFFYLRELGNTYTVTITPGNYSRRSFQNTLQSALNTASGNAWSYIVTYPTTTTSADTGKFTYSVTGNSGQPSFVFGLYLYQQLGFNIGSTNTFSASTLTSTNVINLNRETTLYLHSDIASNGSDDIIQEIFTAGDPSYSSTDYQCIDLEAYSKELTLKTTNVYSFKLTDEDDNIVSLNGTNMVLVLCFYKSNLVYSIIEKFLKLLTYQI